MKIVYIVARSFSGRPTLQHKLKSRSSAHTLCGTDTSEWSRAYQTEPIKAILCRRCDKLGR